MSEFFFSAEVRRSLNATQTMMMARATAATAMTAHATTASAESSAPSASSAELGADVGAGAGIEDGPRSGVGRSECGATEEQALGLC